MAINAKKEWFQYVITHDATTHATLAQVSLDIDFVRGQPASIATLYHQAEAIRLARTLVGESSESALQVLAGTAALLITTEVSVVSPKALVSI